ncbi:hypothetical protein NQ314_000917 [Rhamnusium bicolor]|uniref:SCP domain-containing protein n=1 Tax=Rhamnusium bicolor TaxID=1586634 RepID=A0AAV8ZUL2_9CUCU|nr:hypothetical protein NQ314_000917 [Rhamnusium bicolor]
MMYSYTLFLCVSLLSALTLCDAASKIFENGLTERDKRIIVDKHNEVRRLVAEGKISGQPKGTNFKQMKYDETLARAAQQISNTCIFAHKKVTDNRWQAVGQNLYTSMSTAFSKGADWSSAIKSWSDEYKFYKYGGPINSKNGHYTQVSLNMSTLGLLAS